MADDKIDYVAATKENKSSVSSLLFQLLYKLFFTMNKRALTNVFLLSKIDTKYHFLIKKPTVTSQVRVEWLS